MPCKSYIAHCASVTTGRQIRTIWGFVPIARSLYTVRRAITTTRTNNRREGTNNAGIYFFHLSHSEVEGTMPTEEPRVNGEAETKYTVEWSVEVYAVSPLIAAKLARCIQLALKGEPIAFTVRKAHGKAQKVMVDF